MNSNPEDIDRDRGMRASRGESARAVLELGPESLRAFAEWKRECAGDLAAPIDLRAAMRELFTVHCVEQARLLRAASRLRCESTRLGTLFLGASESDARARACERATLDAREAQWRTEAAEELDACLFDGWEPSCALSDCAWKPRAKWASSRALARAAFALGSRIGPSPGRSPAP